MIAERRFTIGLRVAVLAYLGLLLLVPVGMVLYRTFEHGIAPVIDSVTTPAAVSAFWLTIEIAALALVRGRFRGKVALDAVINLPFALSPVVIGLALLLVYGNDGWIRLPFQVIFAVPGMILATVFVSLPFVVREVAPVLREIGDDQEKAALTLGASPWQAFRRVTLPAIRWGLAYGIV